MDVKEFDVIVIGGGITGLGTARDCALRGLSVLLLERHDIACGATGRNHGLLHSGARYAVTDRESAEECIKENLLLKKMASECIEDTSGFFITLPEDDLGYQKTFVESCRKAGIKAEITDPKEALKMEPSMNPEIIGAVRVPDASVDPFKLSSANLKDAKDHGAVCLIHREVLSFIREGDAIVGVRTRDNVKGEEKEFRGRIIVNAAGIWGHRIAEMAGADVGMFPAKGSLLIFAHRVSDMVVNRCRKPANADILVPGGTVSVIGTTSTRVPYEECDNLKVTAEEVDLLLSEGAKLVPSLKTTRILRAYAGVRPLVAAEGDTTGRNISRGIVCIDHEERDGIRGFITITGGKLMTYRLMAEKTADLVCKKLDIDAKCMTSSVPLPSIFKKADNKNLTRNPVMCECENVPMTEISSAIETFGIDNLVDLRRRTRFGMGTCQGELCACRAADMMNRIHGTGKSGLSEFIQERWKGIYPVAWGDALRESEFTQWVYNEVLGIEKEGIR